MRKISQLTLVFCFLSQFSIGQVYNWNGSQSNDYRDSLNWTPSRIQPSATDTLSFNASAAINLTNVPGQTISAIRIASGTKSVSFSATASATLVLNSHTPLIYNSAGGILAGDFLTLQLGSASSFTINAGTFGIAPSRGGKVLIDGAVTLNGGKLDFDVAATGGATIEGPLGSITYLSGTFASAKTSSVRWTNGSNYHHGANGSAASAIPAATWYPGSTCSITGMNTGSIAPTGFAGINFANITWNCPSQSANVTLFPSGTTTNIYGNLSIENTGTHILQFSSGKTTVKTVQFSLKGGSLTMQTGQDTTILTVSGNFSQTAGILNGISGSSPGAAILDLKGNVDFVQNATWQSTGTNSEAQIIYQFSGSAVQTVNIAGTWNSPAGGRCNIVNNNTETINGVTVTGNLRAVNTSNATHAATVIMNGVFTGPGQVVYSGAAAAGTTLIYSANFFQTASAVEFPTVGGPRNLVIKNPLVVSFPENFNRQISGTLALNGGNLAIGKGDTLSLTNPSLAAQLSYTDGFITTGTLGRNFPVSGLPTSPQATSLFPFGTGTNTRFLNIFFSATALTDGTAGMIYVSHSPLVDATPINLADNAPHQPFVLDKRTNTYWTVGTGNFNLGGGGETVSITTMCANIGSISNYTFLHLTDGVTANFGTLITPSGNNTTPTIGKSGLSQSALNKQLYVGSDSHNALILITYTWTGNGADNDWTTPGNWSGGTGYPSAPTEKVVINSTSGKQPAIMNGTTIDIYQLNVGSAMTLTLSGNALINVYDAVNFTGTAAFSPTSTFGYASSDNVQNILDLPYGGLSLSGVAPKILPVLLTLKGAYSISGAQPTINQNTFVYAGAGNQTILPTRYYNLTINGNRAGGLITLGGPFQNTIDIANNLNVGLLSNYTVFAGGNVVNFSGKGSQFIPGFYYNSITNSGNGPRTLDPLGHTDSAHVIIARTIDRGGGAFTIANSKINLYVSGTRNTAYGSAAYYDLTLSGDLKNFILGHLDGSTVSIAGTFDCKVTNFQLSDNDFQFFFNGTGNQTIKGFKGDSSTNTPMFRYSNIVVAGGNRNVTLEGADTISITGNLLPETAADGSASPFTANKGFVVNSSTIEFGEDGSIIPVLKPLQTGGSNYNNVVISNGTRNLVGNLVIGGDLTIIGKGQQVPAALNVAAGRTLKINGNLNVNVTGQVPQ